MHVRTYICVHKVHVRMQENNSGHIVAPPKAGSWEKACVHVNKRTHTPWLHPCVYICVCVCRNLEDAIKQVDGKKRPNRRKQTRSAQEAMQQA